MIAYGPVPSRRLGHSLGINNIPAKVCSYDCVYCQLGSTKVIEHKPRQFYTPQKIYSKVLYKIRKAEKHHEPIDYLTFVSDGEPTLDMRLGQTIELLKSFGIKVGVISNGSLLWSSSVRQNLLKADWVSLKIDVFQEKAWHQINRPHEDLQWRTVLEGVLSFANSYSGMLVTETMLIQGGNTDEVQMRHVRDFIGILSPAVVYLSIPTRPPTCSWVRAPEKQTLHLAYQIFKKRLPDVELLTADEGNAFAFTGNVEDDLMSITAVHPMREEAVKDLLRRAGARWGVVQKMIDEGKVVKLPYKGTNFYIRRHTVSVSASSQ
jgi:wyosine [tRNA(Phe)-imidazoG37] synthetase (radical SAM superfamily)